MYLKKSQILLHSFFPQVFIIGGFYVRRKITVLTSMANLSRTILGDKVKGQSRPLAGSSPSSFGSRIENYIRKYKLLFVVKILTWCRVLSVIILVMPTPYSCNVDSTKSFKSFSDALLLCKDILSLLKNFIEMAMIEI